MIIEPTQAFAVLGLGIQELVIILAIILLLFGGKKLPELSKSLGGAIKDIRKGFSDNSDEQLTDNKKSSENKKNNNSV